MSTKVRKLARAILLHIADNRNIPVGPQHPGWAFALQQAQALCDVAVKFNLEKTDAPGP